MIQNLILGIFFRKYYCGHTTVKYSSTRSRGHHQSFFFIISDILAKSLKAKTITSEKDDLFHNTVRSKTSLILRASTHLTLKIGCSLSTAKSLSDFTNFQQTCFCLVLEKVFVLYICGCPITAFSRHF